MCRDQRTIYDFKDHLRNKINEIDRQIVSSVVTETILDDEYLAQLKLERADIQNVIKHLDEFEKKFQVDLFESAIKNSSWLK